MPDKMEIQHPAEDVYNIRSFDQTSFMLYCAICRHVLQLVQNDTCYNSYKCFMLAINCAQPLKRLILSDLKAFNVFVTVATTKTQNALREPKNSLFEHFTPDQRRMSTIEL